MDEKHKEIGGYGDNCLQCHADGKKPKDGAETRQPGPIVAAGTTRVILAPSRAAEPSTRTVTASPGSSVPAR